MNNIYLFIYSLEKDRATANSKDNEYEIEPCVVKNKIKKKKELSKPFQCPKCLKQFRQKSHLTVHLRCLHSEDKPFMCSYCGKLFAVASNHRKVIKVYQPSSKIDLFNHF